MHEPEPDRAKGEGMSQGVQPDDLVPFLRCCERSPRPGTRERYARLDDARLDYDSAVRVASAHGLVVRDGAGYALTEHGRTFLLAYVRKAG